jgi:hypothetical protein
VDGIGDAMTDGRRDAVSMLCVKAAISLCFLWVLVACVASNAPKNAPAPSPSSKSDSASQTNPDVASKPGRTATVVAQGQGHGVDSPPDRQPDAKREHGRSPASGSSAKPEPLTLEERLERAVSDLKTGTLAYHFPEKMKTGETAPVLATIATGRVTEEQLMEVFSAADRPGVQTAKTPVTPKMKMTLTSADFEITPQSSDEQIVVGTTPTEWRWTILPKHSGKLQLHLAAIIELENLKQDFKTVDREVDVRVDAVNAVESFVGNNWQWLISGTGGLAIVGGLWNRVRRKKQPVEDVS